MATSEYVYIDGAYFRGIVEDVAKRYGYPFDIDYVLFFGQFERKFYYDCLPPRRKGEDEAEHKERTKATQAIFDELLETEGFRVHMGQIAGEGQRMRQKGVDVQLAVHMLSHAHKGISKRMALVAGDADFVPLAQAVGFEGVYLSLWFDKRNASRDLRRAVDSRVPLTITRFRDALKDRAHGLPTMSGEFEKNVGGLLLVRTGSAGGMAVELYEAGDQAVVIFRRGDHFWHIRGRKSAQVILYFEDECGCGPVTWQESK